MEPIKPEDKERLLADRPESQPALEEYEQLLAARFLSDPDGPAMASPVPTAQPVPDEATFAIDDSEPDSVPRRVARDGRATAGSAVRLSRDEVSSREHVQRHQRLKDLHQQLFVTRTRKKNGDR
jgi:hypothetical protein